MDAIVGFLGSPTSATTDARASSLGSTAPARSNKKGMGWAARMARSFAEAVS
jgi:hypothetical protein